MLRDFSLDLSVLQIKPARNWLLMQHKTTLNAEGKPCAALCQSGYSLPCPLKAAPESSGLSSEKLHLLPCIAGISAIAFLEMNWKLPDQQSEKLFSMW